MYRYLLAHLLSNLPRIDRQAALPSAGVIFVAIIISGCGNKGDLYLPEDVSTTYQTYNYKAPNYQAPKYQTLANQNKD